MLVPLPILCPAEPPDVRQAVDQALRVLLRQPRGIVRAVRDLLTAWLAVSGEDEADRPPAPRKEPL